MDTPITSEPLEPTQPDLDQVQAESDAAKTSVGIIQQMAVIRLVHVIGKSVKHLNPDIASALTNFEEVFEADIKEYGSKPVLPVEHAKVESLNESPNKPLK
jgi:hypothetical protein